MTADAANADRRSSDSSKSLLIRTPTQITRAKALVPSEGEMLPPQKRKMRVTARADEVQMTFVDLLP